MDINTGFLIYATVFRLAVIVAGMGCTILGYRLFVLGVMSGKPTDVEGQAGGIRLTLKNAAPGTCFALFGCFIIAIMLFEGNPELVIEEINKVSKISAAHETVRKVRMKGGNGGRVSLDSESFVTLFRAGLDYTDKGDDKSAIDKYGQALSIPEVPLSQAVKAFNQLAFIYQRQGRVDEALPLARLAVNVDKTKGDYLDTLAIVLLKRHEYPEALKRAHAAVAQRPQNADFLYTLALCQKGNGELHAAHKTMKKAAEIDPANYQSKLVAFQQTDEDFK